MTIYFFHEITEWYLFMAFLNVCLRKKKLFFETSELLCLPLSRRRLLFNSTVNLLVLLQLGFLSLVVAVFFHSLLSISQNICTKAHLSVQQERQTKSLFINTHHFSAGMLLTELRLSQMEIFLLYMSSILVNTCKR